MDIIDSAKIIYDLTHPENADSFNELSEYLNNMYFA